LKIKKYVMRKPFSFANWRFSFLKAVFTLVPLLIFFKLFYLQILNHAHYQILAENQHWLRREIPAVRGEILSSDGFKLATNEEAYLLFAVPPEIENKDDVVKQLVETLGPEEILGTAKDEKCLPAQAGKMKNEKLEDGKCVDDADSLKLASEKLVDQLSQPDRYWVPLAHKVSIKTRDQIAQLNLPGIYFESQEKRVYPEGSLAAHLLGFVGKNDAGEDRGYFGLEGYYNGDLSGQKGFAALERDASGKPIPIGGTQIINPENGRTLVLTINREVQYLLEKKLAQGVKKYGAADGTAILLEPETGKILALANYPTFEPENWTDYLGKESDVAKIDIFRDIAIASAYEPGSVLKSVTMSAALEGGTVRPETIYNDRGPMQVGGYLIKTWDNKYHGEIDMAQILQLSNNTGASWIAQKMGFSQYWRFVEKFGLGEKTGIDLEGEAQGIVKPHDEWREIDLATAAFGQGIAVTPIRLATIFATIANNGVMMKPYLVEEIRQESSKFKVQSSKLIKLKPQEIGRVISKETAKTLKEMLQSVIEKGEFKWFVKNAGMDKFALAGKTGTAQIPVGGSYDPHKTEVTFVGFAPIKTPKFVLLLKMSKPTASTYSAETAVPLWLEMAKELVIHFNITPTH